ncbi:torsin-1A-like isoform X1 [Ruditapes philippinarum]|uniref:torsin-1A-like isoform X1 n=1 Tax=Ruditapes philippinarum TaxID=129788 RepID=UPI00295C26A3|nr:torsin-1A-like isoform X1 [Ruditapes philippinarum]
MPVCVCNTLWTLTCIVAVIVFYHFTTIFVWTVTTGLVALILFLVISEDNHGNYCLRAGIFGSLAAVVFVVVVPMLAKGLLYGYTFTTCYFNECCDDNWISPNISGLSFQLNKKLYGQHLVIGPLVKHLRGHVEGQHQKATILSLHGLPGTGKNFVSRMVAQNMYVKGMESKYVHLLSATKDFPHESMLEEYKEKLKLKIETAGKECSMSVFIIDEMDKLLPGLIDTIRPYVDYYDHVEGTYYKKLLFLFLSNTGGDSLAKHAVQNNARGYDRRDLRLKDMEEIVRTSSLHEPNGMVNSSIVKNSLITAYIPFLPLERKHVEKCIVDGLFAREFYAHEYQVDYELVKTIADEMLYFPEFNKLFSTTGCKRVMEKIDLIMLEEA